MSEVHDVVVVGGGQSGLAVGYYLRRSGLGYSILDAQEAPGGAWRHGWGSLRLFSPARWSSLPGRLMEGGTDEYPTRDELLEYLADYEERYELPIERPIRVQEIVRDGDWLLLRTSAGDRRSRAVVSATGGWEAPYVPDVSGRDEFGGIQMHSAHYQGPGEFAGMRVIVVGGGNSGAQILAELSRVADTTWVTLKEPVFLPDHIDGRYLFEQATELWRAMQEGRDPPPQASLGDIVMVAPVRDARERGVLDSVRPFTHFTRDGVVWPDGRETAADAVIWCTGFRAALQHLAPLDAVDAKGRVAVRGTRSVAEPRLWLVGYGNWTGFASATLIGVGRTARATVEEIVQALGAA